MRPILASLLFLTFTLPVAAEDLRVLTIADVHTLVAERNRELKTARRNEEAAEADRIAAAVTAPPQLSLNTQSIDFHNTGDGGLWNRRADTILRLDKTLELGGKAALRTAGADAALAASRADRHDTLRQQQAIALMAYWDLKLAQRQLELAEANLRLAKESHQAAQLRTKAGDLPRIEAQRLQLEAERAANELSNARMQRSLARNALASLLALESEAPRLFASADWPAPGGDAPAQPDLQARSDVLAARARSEQARRALELAQAQRSADITVGIQFEHYPPDGKRLWGIGMSMPIGQSARQDGPIQRAGVALAEAEAQLERSQAEASAQWQQAREQMQSARERLLRQQNELIPQARAVFQTVSFAHQHGALGLQDLLDARRTLHAAELDAEQAQADHAKALAMLAAAAESDSPSLSEASR